MDMEAEGVVAPCHVSQALLDAAIVLGVDDRLLAVVGPGMGAGCSQRRAVCAGQSKQAPAPVALTGQRIVQVGADARDDLDLRADQLTGDALVQDLIALRGRAQLLEARHQIEALRVEDRELLLHPHGEVRGLGKYLGSSV